MKRHWSLTIWLNPRDWEIRFVNYDNGYRHWVVGPFDLVYSRNNRPPVEVKF
jgi:hypothetical protein